MMRIDRTFTQLCILGAIGLTLLSCGSEDKKSKDSEFQQSPASEASSAKNSTADSHEEAPPPAKAPTMTTPLPTTTSSVAKSRFQSALKSQDEEMIYKASTEVLSHGANKEAFNALGIYHLRKGRPLAAQFFLQKALNQDANNTTLHNNLGIAFLAQKKEKEAVAEWKRALELNPKDSTSAGLLGNYYLKRRDPKRAYVYLDQGFRNSSKNLTWLLNYGLASTWHGDLEQADKLYQKAMDASPNNPEVLYNFAVLKIAYQHQIKEGLDLVDRIKVIGVPESLKAAVIQLENDAKAGVK